ncbi:UNVERIFIED_CONTAM: protein FAR1-RELATED SEQUENCE 6 [Sesamum radiatum]|uniref:Protein FAR1-RELATED SEQUENCE n=1 Tax=Sesamum radiatum TaxID=300843 RepID=A0AAW2PIE6_SESRA
MEEISLHTEQTTDGLPCETPPGTNDGKAAFDDQNGNLEGNNSEGRKEFVAPAVGMEFETYDDAYNYYNCYAREAGFSGFKRVKDVNRLRKETRTGCPAMMRMRYEIPLVAFVGINHHGQPVLLGCGLLASETMESYIWLFKAWVACTSGHPPQTIITDRCKVLQRAVTDVFPKSHHRFGLSHIMRKVPEKLGGLRNYDAIRKALLKGVYEALKPFDFEAAWGFMIQRFGVADNEWLRSLYEDRALWAPVYLKDTFFMGMATTRPGRP